MQQHLPGAHGGPAGLSPGMINPHAAGLPPPSGLLGTNFCM